ncbi:hypothetical protein BJ878DRAFT_492155 [Calycina marina]|uniref:gamma-glutamylcyclotransferase n=1 Tax=Calycina marina TaxID=1763456 RepID=A0A9P8CJG3_9HELO|nr:hypothetical protein BJ878DRAFT_492155 [Calycina marina]
MPYSSEKKLATQLPETQDTQPARTSGLLAWDIMRRMYIVRTKRFRSEEAVIAKLPETSLERLSAANSKSTVLYLAYGSNLSAETFKGNRGIKPLSAINVHVPALDLTFDLAGIPYNEPCFANTRYRPTSGEHTQEIGWHKGLVGVVYEVTLEDYRTIIATEGGGASYKDIKVDCYILPGNTAVPSQPVGTPFKAHTLFCPRGGEKLFRPDQEYAQASVRYLNLITDGAEEHDLPAEYMAYLYSLQPYTITSTRQTIGKGIFTTIWMPVILALFGLGKQLADEDGKVPTWLARCYAILFLIMWTCYDAIFKPVFGDGERTVEKEGDMEIDSKSNYHKCGRRC